MKLFILWGQVDYFLCKWVIENLKNQANPGNNWYYVKLSVKDLLRELQSYKLENQSRFNKKH